MFNKQMIKLKPLWKRVVNRETITYGIAGVLTTLVNIYSYYLFCNILGIKNLIANAIAWIVAVVFAYIVNDIWVFQSKVEGLRKEVLKIAKFFGARIVSFLVEEAGLYVFVDVLHWNNLIVKAGLAVVVIILNYLFSKLYIFNKT